MSVVSPEKLLAIGKAAINTCLCCVNVSGSPQGLSTIPNICFRDVHEGF